MRNVKLYGWSILIFMKINVFAQQPETIIYKEIDTVKLIMDIYYPEKFDAGASYPALVFFFGGGWTGGDTKHFQNQARYFANRGMVVFAPEYRIRSKHHTTPFEALMDAKSAMRYIKQNAALFKIDTTMLVAGGGSAGGHLAAATAIIKAFNDPTDDLGIDPAPKALLLFNPVIDNGPGGYGYERVKEAYKDFSPLHNLDSLAPPTLFLLGTEDNLIPVETAKYYCTIMKRTGGQCKLVLYEGAGHGFFNPRNPDYHTETMLEADRFLQSLGIIEAPDK